VEIEDRLIKSVDWNPDLHPRTGTPPNPGWFAPTDDSDSESSPIQTAQNDDPTLGSDAPSSTSDDWVRLPPGKRIDELGDFLEWLANAKSEDESAIRGEIKHYYYDVGDTIGGNALNAALSDVLDAGVDQQTRQEILDSIAPYANADPAEVAQFRNLTVGGILVFPGMPPPAIVDAPSEVWKLGWAARGAYINEQLGANLPSNFPVVDSWLDGVVTSIKSIDLNAATYQDAMRLTYRLNQYINQLALFDGGKLGYTAIDSSAISGRVLSIAVPKATITAAQRAAIATAKLRANAFDINLVITEF
jgi:contact-dependent growth inhibition (CDI) system restriction endonuclease-like protein